MSTTLPLRQEIILGPDGKFIKRETRESVIADADTAITACMRDDTLSVCLTYLYQSLSSVTRVSLLLCTANSGINPEACYAFVNLADGLPLPGAKFQPTEYRELCELFVPGHREREGEPMPDNIIEPSDMPMHNNTDYAMWVMDEAAFVVDLVLKKPSCINLMRQQQLFVWHT